MKILSNSFKLTLFVMSKMIDLITFLDKNGKASIYTGRYFYDLYNYLWMIGVPTNLNYSIYFSHYCVHFDNNDKYSLQPVIKALCVRQNITCECCGWIGHKSVYYIIIGHKFLQPSLVRNMNQYNRIKGDKPSETPIYFNNNWFFLYWLGGLD